MVRKTQQVEVAYVASYVKDKYSQFPRQTNVPLGRVSEKLMAEVGYQKAIKMSRPVRPEVDAVVFLPRYLVLIEGKIREIMIGLCKLPFYKSLVPSTPEFKPYRNIEVIMEFVSPWLTENHRIMAEDANIRAVEYHTPEADAEVERYHKYWTREYRLAREEKLRNRELLGLE